MKEHIVIIVGSYYPNYSAVGRCMGNIAEELVHRGYKVTVISQKTDLNETDEEQANGHTIIRTITKRRFAILSSRKSNTILSVMMNYVFRVLKSLQMLLNKQSIYREEIKAYVDKIEALSDEPSILIPTCLPFETVCAAVEYKNRHHQIRIYPVLYDLFATNGRLQKNRINMHLKMKYNQQIELKMLGLSQEIFGLHTWYDYIKLSFPDYLNKFTEIEHPLLTDSSLWGTLERNNDSTIMFVYAGSVDMTIRNPTYVLNFFDEYTKESNSALHLFSMGSAQPIVEEFAKKNSKIISHGAMPNSIVRKHLNSADFLISIGNTNTVQTPSKIFEYFCTGNPIIHFAFDANDPVIDTLKKYPNKHIIIINEPIRDAIGTFSGFVSDSIHKRLPFSEVSKLYIEANPGFVVDQIES